MTGTAPGTRFRFSITPDPRELPRRHRRALNNAHREAAEYHHQKHIPLHFQPDAYQRYGYQRRGRNYIKLKARLFGEGVAQLPNVLTGNSRRLMRTQRQITSTASGSRLILRFAFSGGTGRLMDAKARLRVGKKALTQRGINASKNVITRIAELETVTAGELNTLARITEESYHRQIVGDGKTSLAKFDYQ